VGGRYRQHTELRVSWAVCRPCFDVHAPFGSWSAFSWGNGKPIGGAHGFSRNIRAFCRVFRVGGTTGILCFRRSIQQDGGVLWGLVDGEHEDFQAAKQA